MIDAPKEPRKEAEGEDREPTVGDWALFQKIAGGCLTAAVLGLFGFVLSMAARVAVIENQQVNLETRIQVEAQTHAEVAAETSKTLREMTKDLQEVRISLERLLVVKPADVYQRVELLDKRIKDAIEEIRRGR